ncbi:DUF3237 family protein [Parasphingorhabdus sp.]|uniref:DUF3237 family protein n=1 Tax=Parasphingorhabdus sp. TaxID=2709688 RepID=UPI0032653741
MTNSTALAKEPRTPAEAATGEERAVKMEEISVVALQITDTVDFGTTMEDVMSGAVTPPLSGTRLNIAFEGTTEGVLVGTMTGVDYSNIRADGRLELNIHAVIVTPEGDQIAYEANGVLVPQPDGVGIVREAAKLTTTSPNYAWVNGYTFISEGTVDTNTGKIDLVLYK